MGQMGCPETSLRNYHYSLNNNTEERRSQYEIVLVPKMQQAVTSVQHFTWQRWQNIAPR